MEKRKGYPVPRMASQLDMGTFTIYRDSDPVGWAWAQNANATGYSESWVVRVNSAITPGNTGTRLDLGFRHEANRNFGTRAEFLAWVGQQCAHSEDYYHYHTDSLIRDNFSCP